MCVDGGADSKKLFQRFEPVVVERFNEDFTLFSPFKPHTEEAQQKIHEQLKKAYLDHNFQQMQENQKRRKIRLQYGKKTDNQAELGSDSKTNYISEYLGLNKKQNVRSKSTSFLPKPLPLFKLKPADGSEKQSQIAKNRQTVLKSSREYYQKHYSGHPKFIFVKSRLLSKQYTFDLVEYFNHLSGGSPIIRIREFFQAFQSKPCMKRLVSSLYAFLDKDQRGEVDFYTFVRQLHPDLSDNDMKSVRKWAVQYHKTYDANFDQNMFQDDDKAQRKQAKKILPGSSIRRLKEMFDSLDQGGKGYLVFDDFRRNFKLGYNLTDIQNIFKDFDSHGDGKIRIVDFARILLPPNFTIQGIEALNDQYDTKLKEDTKERKQGGNSPVRKLSINKIKYRVVQSTVKGYTGNFKSQQPT